MSTDCHFSSINFKISPPAFFLNCDKTLARHFKLSTPPTRPTPPCSPNRRCPLTPLLRPVAQPSSRQLLTALRSSPSPSPTHPPVAGAAEPGEDRPAGAGEGALAPGGPAGEGALGEGEPAHRRPGVTARRRPRGRRRQPPAACHHRGAGPGGGRGRPGQGGHAVHEPRKSWLFLAAPTGTRQLFLVWRVVAFQHFSPRSHARQIVALITFRLGGALMWHISPRCC